MEIYIVFKTIHAYWKNNILENAGNDVTLKHLDKIFTVGSVHPLLKWDLANPNGLKRIPVRVKVATGNYALQSNRAKFSESNASPLC